jgi:hypothetical protein
MVAAPSLQPSGRIMTSEQITLILFTIFNMLRIIGYLPQIVLSLRDTSGGASTSITAWMMFFSANISAAAYAVVNAKDPLMALLFGGNALGCLAIALLTYWKRRELIRTLARQASRAAADQPIEVPASQPADASILPVTEKPALTLRNDRLPVMNRTADLLG